MQFESEKKIQRKVSTYHEQEQQQHQQRQHGLCDCGRFNGPPILLVVLCVAPMPPPPTVAPRAPPLPCDEPRSRQLALDRSCNSDTLHDILSKSHKQQFIVKTYFFFLSHYFFFEQHKPPLLTRRTYKKYCVPNNWIRTYVTISNEALSSTRLNLQLPIK